MTNLKGQIELQPNYAETMSNLWQNYGETMSNLWQNYDKIMAIHK